MLKKILCTLLILSIVLAMMPVAFAENAGASMDDAIDVEFGKDYEILWTKDTYELDSYHRFTVAERGYVTFRMTKPLYTNGNRVPMDLTFLDSEGTPLLQDNTTYSDDTLDYYEYSIALNAGTYYLNMVPNAAFYGELELTSNYSFTFTANAFCEVEPNGSSASATKLELGQAYTGFWGDTEGEEDWFTFDLEAGKTTKICIGNFEYIHENTYTIVDLLASDESKIFYLSYYAEYDEAEEAYAFTFVPSYSGKYYVRWWNNHYSQFTYSVKVTQTACAHSYNAGVCTICGEKDPNYEIPVTPSGNPFKDVRLTDYFYDPVLWAVDKGVTTGMSATKFGPNENCTRGQIVTFLWRANGSPEPTKTDNPFKDVKSSDYFYKAVLWAVEKGITTGLSATSFGPNAVCTRGQVATFLYRAQGQPEVKSDENPFKDVKSSDYFYAAVLWAVGNNVTQGMGGGKFAPNASCTRGQIVTFLYRAIV